MKQPPYVIGDVGPDSFQLILDDVGCPYTRELIIDYRLTINGYKCLEYCTENCYDVDGELYSWCYVVTPDWIDEVLPQIINKRGF